MNKTILDLSNGTVHNLEVDSAISFRPFMDHLQKRANEEQTIKATLYKTTLEVFNKGMYTILKSL